MGGVVVDPETTATDLDGLFAAGETTSGLHGANRLGGNSLAETLVFGRRAGEQAAARSASMDVSIRPRAVVAEAADELEALVRPGNELARPVQRAVRDLMWKTCGVVRDADGLHRGLEGLRDLGAMLDEIDVSPTEEGWGDLGLVLDLRASLLTAEATIIGALARRETRGAHNRADFPEIDDSGLVRHRVRRDPSSGELALTSDPVPPVSAELKSWLEQPLVQVGGDRLLE